MTARWDRLPANARPITTPHAPTLRGRWRCRACDTLIVGTWASAERHADTHGGSRLDVDLSAITSTDTTTSEGDTNA